MIGLCSVTFRNKQVEEIIDLVRKSGLDLIEWASNYHVPENDEANARRVASLMKEAGLKSVSYGSYYRLGSGEDFESFIQVAKILGASTLRVWAGEKASQEADEFYRNKVIEDAKRISQMANQENLTISLEYHANTLTDSPQSALDLMEAINRSNVRLYWQPAESLTVEERLESIPKLARWITNVHVFNWQDYYHQFPLEDAYDEWQQYITLIETHSPYDQHYFLEFVPGQDQIQGFFQNAETLKKLVQ